MPDIAATGVYSVEGQDALANDLAGIDPNAVDDDGAVTDGGVVVDTGGIWDEQGREIEPEVDPHQLAADRIQAELETEESALTTAEWLEQHEQEQQDAAYAEAVENYHSLAPEEKAEVNTEWLGRASEEMAQHVDPTLAQQMTADMFGDQPGVDPVAAATLLGVGCKNIIESLENAGVTSLDQLTPEVIQQVNDPEVAQVFVSQFLPAIGLGEMLAHINAAQFVGELLPFVPVLMSGQNPNLVQPEFKVAYVQSLCRAFGFPIAAPAVDQDAAAARFASDAKWFGKIGAYLQASREQSTQRAQPAKTQGRTPRRASQDDAFWGEGLKLYHERHAGV